MLAPEAAGFAQVDGDIGATGYNETTVDVIAVPCIGASPYATWDRDPLPDGYFEFSSRVQHDYPAICELTGSAILTPAVPRILPKSLGVWIRHGIRGTVNSARVLLYQHRKLCEGLTIDQLADDLLESIQRDRQQARSSRPLFFICHSIGGLVVKRALTRASERGTNHGWILQNCHGITFFCTPHLGSDYLSMPNLRNDLPQILHLESPLPLSITHDLRLANRYLRELQTSFTQIAGDIHVWSFYETVNTQLSGSGSAAIAEVSFDTLLVPVQSALLGMRREQVFSLDSDHAHCASFGLQNSRKMQHYLLDLGNALRNAEELVRKYVHTPFNLSQRVKIDLTGFYENPDPGTFSHLVYSSRYPLEEFLQKGLETCIQERLHTTSPRSIKTYTRSRASKPATGFGIHHATSETSGRDTDATISRRRSDPEVGSSQYPPSLSTPDIILIAPTKTDDKSPHVAEAPEQRVLHVSSTLKDLPAGFSRPDPNRRKYHWIHVPFNNPQWVERIFNSLSDTDHRDYSDLLRGENWHSGRVRHAQSHVPHVKPGCGFDSINTIESPSRGKFENPLRHKQTFNPLNTAAHLHLYLPYLHYDTYISMVKRRQLLLRRLKHGRAHPVPRDVAELESLELRVIWGEIGNETPLNLRRTLDQYGQPWLKDTSARDDSQMLYKLTKEKDSASGPRNIPIQPTSMTDDYKSDYSDVLDDDIEGTLLNGNVLMVDQLWLWAFDSTTLVTFFTERETSPLEGTLFQAADLWISIHNQINGPVRCENALDLAALVTLHAVTVLLDQNSHPDLEVFRIFEEAIGIMAERMTSSLRRFRMQASPHLMPVTDVSAEEAEKKRISIEKRQEQELEQAERMNREDTSVLLELRDANDELTTLRDLFTEQTTIVETMRDSYLKRNRVEITQNGVLFLDRALERLGEYRKQVSDMMDRIDTVKKDYQTLLEMMQRVDDVRFSRLQTELARSQNRTLMIFTSFTVIFLPLSFFTSLFGMNTQEWGGDNNISLRVIGAISLPASALLVLTSLIVAFSTRVQTAIKKPFKPLKSQVQEWQQKLKATKPRRKPVLRSRQSRSADYDFWESVREAKMEDYTIPDVNRKRR
ncbi:hypothetical protein GGS24DRAFT_484034 [Hypoxylon argillaceum]|nr:hypothetical protein GGS24DRAFT_484034 [Hypoxylon argillaceum]